MSIKWQRSGESVTVIVDGVPHTFQAGTPNYEGINNAINSGDPEDIRNHLTVASSVEQWAGGAFSVQGEKVIYNGEPLPDELNKRIVAMAAEGKDPGYLFKFWERLQKNPSYRSVQQLYGFMNHVGIPIDSEGFILAYKAVRRDWKDIYSGTVLNTVGAEIDYPRNKISDDPRVACHVGLHSGALSYAQQYGGENSRIIIVKIDPADVVCIPDDEGFRKMRMCKYKVVGEYAGQMPDTTIDPEDVPPEFEEFKDEGDEVDLGYDPAPKAEPQWNYYTNMDYNGLLDCTLDELRKYATYGVKLVGASKIPGGKDALIRRILSTRGE